MYDPFKRARSNTRRRIRQATVSAFADLFTAKAGRAASAKRTASKVAKPAAKPTNKASGPSAEAGKGRQRSKTIGKLELPATSRARTTTPRGATFRKGVHVCEFGERSFRLYIPAIARTAKSPLPLLVMLHGCSQTPEDFARGTGMNTLAEEFGFLVVYPAQEHRSQMYRCWNWYKRGDQVRGAGEPALLASLVRHTIVEQGADPAKVYVAGLSAGASAALILADAYPDIFAAVGAHSGLPVGAAHDETSAVISMQHGAPGRRHSVSMPTISFHGSSDRVVNPRNGRYVAMRALDPYLDLRKTEKIGHAAGGRKYVRTSHRVGRGRSFIEHWVVVGAAHAWSGGNAAGSYTDPTGPDASREMIRFFLRHRTTAKRRSTSPT
jgi:poly(hydroxyalkanoate) depolymerase family esterase